MDEALEGLFQLPRLPGVVDGCSWCDGGCLEFVVLQDGLLLDLGGDVVA